VPAEVKEINVGPAVTQFGVEPGHIERPGPDGAMHRHRVRVSKISALVNDLALALAAAPIRIEAPVPGRPFVGIEVPNTQVSLVSLRGVLESETYRKEKGLLRIPLGRDVSGAAVAVDLAAMPHLLIAGATGSGKSVCINAIVTGLICDHGPDELKFLMVDPKMVELTGFEGVPHLLAPVIVDVGQVVGALAWITRMMDERYQRFADAGARNITDYNKRVVRRRGEEQMPHVIVIVDELADLMMMAPDETERHITRIAQMARATGIHLVIATQRPSVDVVTGLIKANFPARIAFAVTSQIDSRVILDTPGAERLLGRGDMLLMLPDSPKLQRLQGCFVSDGEIRRVVSFWKETAGELPATVSRPWDGLMAEAEQDNMLEEAIALVTKTGRASTTFLQRRLGIGYPRASRLMDQLEEEGVIGPADGSRPRQVLVGNDDEYADEDETWEP
jgi:S-DNA-T family DNA segregation ATPase FtsK/SpoIIIE